MRYTNRSFFLKAVKNNSVRIFCAAVADDFERGEIFEAILKILAAPDRTLQRFSAAALDWSSFYAHLQTTSLFGGEPIAVLDEVDKLPKKQELLNLPLDYGYLILGARAKSPFLALAEKEGLVLDLLEEKPWEKEKRLSEELYARANQAGKSLSPEVLPMLFDRLDKDSALLQSEIDKLICYSGDEHRITGADVQAISSTNRTYSFWQTAEELVWEGKPLGSFDDSSFHPLIPSIRSQLQLGLKISTLIEFGTARDEWSQVLGRVYPKTLDKRTSQAARLGSAYFSRGLKALFDIELLSRTGSQQYEALLDLFRTQLASYAPR